MIICIIIKMHCKRQFQMHDLHGVFTACRWHAHGSLEDPTALPQYSHSALSNTLCKCQAAMFISSKQTPWHGVLGECLVTAQCTPWQAAIFLMLWKPCKDAAPLWCNRGFTAEHQVNH